MLTQHNATGSLDLPWHRMNLGHGVPRSLFYF